MAFQIQPLEEFLVRPAVPDALARMPELAYNIMWSWEPVIRTLFRRLDPALWKECQYNPVQVLSRVPQQTLEKAATDPRYMAQYSLACQKYDQHMQRPAAQHGDKLIAYFSAEYGLTECIPIYSGGLGILSGDHLKSSSDCGIPLVGVGLLYQRGYFRQLLNPDGWQQERNPVNDFYSLPIKPALDAEGKKVRVQVQMPSGPLTIQSVAAASRPGEALPARYQRCGKRGAGRPRHHRTALRRRQRHAHSPGDCSWHRRHARVECAGDSADGVSHERRPFRVSRLGTHPPVHRRPEAFVPGSARSHALQQCLHHSYAGSCRDRFV